MITIQIRLHLEFVDVELLTLILMEMVHLTVKTYVQTILIKMLLELVVVE